MMEEKKVIEKKRVPVKLMWDNPFSFWANFDSWISGEQATTVQNPNPMVLYDDGTSQRIKAEDLSKILGNDASLVG